eukprot:208026_1
MDQQKISDNQPKNNTFFTISSSISSANEENKDENKEMDNMVSNSNSHKQSASKPKIINNKPESIEDKSNSKNNNKKVDEATQKLIKQKGKELYVFDEQYTIVQYNGKRYISIDGKYYVLNNNHYLFTKTRINSKPPEIKKSGSGNTAKLWCDTCNKWEKVLLKQNKQLKFSCVREKLIVQGMFFINNLSYCRGDYFKRHLKSKFHLDNNENLQNYINKPIVDLMQRVKDKIDAGEMNE